MPAVVETIRTRPKTMKISRISRSIVSTILILGSLSFASFAHACPALDPYYPSDPAQWPRIRQQLQELLPECLLSAEYFALLGASELNSGMLAPALEALERALLLDPDHGAAQFDYAQALYQAGQLFPALEMNRSLLQRNDIPPSLVNIVEARQKEWMGQTSQFGLVTELALGYDNNLNGAPSRSDLTLTLSGEPVQLTLAEEFQPVSGPYLNARLAGIYQKSSPEYSQDLVLSVRNRSSEHRQSDLLQFDWRYALGNTSSSWLWSLTAGTSHLLYGGSPLYSVTEARFQLRPGASGCQPQYELAAQYQRYHGQSIFSGVETSAALGMECRPENAATISGLEIGLVNNRAINELRPGNDRQGWRLRLYWQQQLGKGTLTTQFSLASLQDEAGYNELLADGATREVNSRQFRIQYRRNLQNRLEFLTTISHQGQSSNLVPFQNKGTALEFGLSYSL